MSFATAAPTRWQYLAAYGAVLLLLGLTMAVAPFAKVGGPVLPALLAFYQSAVILADFVTAILLFILYREVAQLDLLLVGSGYLFSCVVAYAHFLSFPGLIAPEGVIGGGPQTAPMLWIVWHGAFPIAVAAAMALRGRAVPSHYWGASLLVALASVALLATALIWLVTVGHDYLPVLIDHGSFAPMHHFAWPGLLLLNLVAAVILGFNGAKHSTLTLWLFVASVALSLEVMMAWQTEHLFSIGWYSSRVLSFVGSAVLAGIFIIENALLLRNSSRLARELRTALLEAHAATLSKSRFFAAASHDLRQPFQAMRLFYGVLEQSIANDKQGTVIAHLGQAMSNAETLLNELLDIARIESRSLTVTPVCVDVRALLDEVVADLSPVAGHRGLSLKACGPVLAVETDRALLKRIVTNLATNGIRYTEAGGILLATRHRAGREVIEVWDTGIGISEQDAAKVFEEFYQVANPGRDRSQGTGLGLAIVTRLASALCCEVTLNSRLGRGSVFRVILPKRRRVKGGRVWRR